MPSLNIQLANTQFSLNHKLGNFFLALDIQVCNILEYYEEMQMLSGYILDCSALLLTFPR